MSFTGKVQSSESAHHLRSNCLMLALSLDLQSVVSPEYQLVLGRARSLDRSKILESDRPWVLVRIAMQVARHRRGHQWVAGRIVMQRFL